MPLAGRGYLPRAKYSALVADFRPCEVPGLPAHCSTCLDYSVATERLPEDPGCYFLPTPGTRLVRLSQLRPSKPLGAPPDSVDHAEQLMRQAAAGRAERRPPVTVRREGEVWMIVDGNATLGVAERHGWLAIPALEKPAS